MSKITVNTAQPTELPEAALLTSRAMIHLPHSTAIFQGKLERMEAAFRIKFERLPGQVFLTKDEGQIVGVMRLVEWPQCKLSPKEALKMLPVILMALKGSMPRAMKFQQVWAQHDPKKHHWHLDPLAVLPERQRQGIGTQLMNHFCEHVDSHEAAGYLETTTMDNVHFYERFGFSVIGETSILGLPAWLMWRPKSQGSH